MTPRHFFVMALVVLVVLAVTYRVEAIRKIVIGA
jgi:hypothetical protein